MTVTDIANRRGECDLSESYRGRLGKDNGCGHFMEGQLTRLNEQYHVEAASKRGYQFRTFVDTVYVGYDDTLDLDVGGTFDLSDLDFRLGENELHLRADS